MAREKGPGSLINFYVTSVTATEIMMSKIWPVGLIVLLGSALALMVAQVLMAVPVLAWSGGSFWR